MGKLLRIHESKYGKVRTIYHDNKSYYHGDDIMKMLGYSDLRALKDCVDSDDVAKFDVIEKETTRDVETTMINLYGTHSLMSAIPMNLGRCSGTADVKGIKKWLLDIDVKNRESSMSDEDKTVLKIYHAKTAEEKANSLVAYKNIIQGKMKTSNNNEGVQLQFEDIKNNSDLKNRVYKRQQIANDLEISTRDLNKFMVIEDWIYRSGKDSYPTKKGLDKGYCVKLGTSSSDFGLSEDAFNIIKNNINIINQLRDNRLGSSDKNIIGEKVGKLTAISNIFKDPKTGIKKVKVQCECGTVKEVSRSNFVNGYIKSCGSSECRTYIRRG